MINFVRKLIQIIILIETIFIIFTVLNIHIKKKLSVDPFNHVSQIYPKDSKFRYYFEFEPSHPFDLVLPWDSKKHISNQINQDGLNDKDDYQVIKPDNVYRVIALGDSFTFGHYVHTEDNWPQKLENLINKKNICHNANRYEIINLGMPGFDIPYITERYIRKGLKYKPDLIIWFESGTGFTRDNELWQPLLDDCKKKISSSNLTYSQVITKCYEENKKIIDAYPLNYVQNYLEFWLRTFLKIRLPTPVIFASFENLDNTSKSLLNSWTKGEPNVYLTNSVKGLSVKTSLPDGHPNEKGHEVIAQGIYNYLNKNKDVLNICK